MLLHRLFERCAQQHADRDAIVFQDTTLTYRDVNTAANQLASHLRQLCGPGQGAENGVVALCLDKSPGMVIAVIAVLKAGMAWVPLPVAAPPAYIQKILDATQPRLIIASQATQHAVSQADGPAILPLDDAPTEAVIKKLPDTDLPVEDEHIGPGALCHLIFTSGSTGTPKGVMIEHRGMVHSIQHLTEMFELNQDTRTLQFATYTFDLFGGDVFMTFLAGGCLIMDTLTNMMSDLPGFMRRHGVTYSQLTPTVASLVRPEDVPSLRLFVSSGEPMTDEVLQRWGRDGNHGGRIRLLNAYGPTETTIICAVQDMTRPAGVMKPQYVGPGLPDLELVLVDPDPDSDAAVDGDVAPGTVGELCIAGVQLFRGYLGEPAPSSSSSFFYRGDKRFYRSGDLGMSMPLNPDDPDSEHTIHLLGRRDRQVKVHGVRLDLGDVENAVAKFPFANHCVTLVPQAGVVEGRLAAVISLRDGPGGLGTEPWEHVAVSTTESKGWDLLLPMAASQQDVLQQLVATVRATVQPHAVPSAWLVVSEFPLTTSGKIDRMAIRGWMDAISEEVFARSVQAWTSTGQGEVNKANGDVEGGHQDDGEDDDATMSPTTRQLQQQLIDMCSRVLGLPPATINPRVSLLQLGLDSMAAIRLVSMAHRERIHFSVQQVLGNTSVSQLAQAVSLSPDSSRSAEDTRDDLSTHDDNEPFALAPVAAEELPALRASVAEQCGVEVDDVLDIYPCTFVQAGMMMLSKYMPGAYASEMQFDFSPDVDRDRLRRACQQLEIVVLILRARLAGLPGPPGSAVQVTIRPDAATAGGRGDFDSPMSYGDSLSRFQIREPRDGKKGFVLAWKAHHSVYDGWAKTLLLRTLKRLYDADGQPINDEPPAPSFRSFIRHITDDTHNREAEHLSFWRDYLDGATVPNIPAIPADQAPTASLPPRDPEVLKYTMAVDIFSTARQHRVTPSTVLLAATPLVLGTHAGSDDVTLSVVLSGRNIPFDGIDRVIGPVFTAVPYRVRWDDRSLTVSEFLATQHQTSIDMIPHAHFGFANIRRASESAEKACQIRCTLIIQPVGGDDVGAHPDLAGFLAEPTDGHSAETVTSPLHIEFIPGATASEGVRVQVMFDSALISRTEVLGMLRELERIINQMGAAAGSDGGPSPAVVDVVADALAEIDGGSG
ncbi:uncharacterized protein C8A04DRAFT_29140 [Dichotomopilus funicola]|uniref:Carrier domain-containing protein n=1 Tax=Dichotomopilus funicola TaxID=1934379 RepID=A0AAN6ZMJ8_9PEZI|nr:hypothetical protein C8A04DRAFT_29140 [Dichotomopilus funicola]